MLIFRRGGVVPRTRLRHRCLYQRVCQTAGPMASWTSLGTPRKELTLDNTLPTGQSFRWRKTSPSTYTGVIGQRVVQVRQLEDDVAYRVIARSPDASVNDDEAVIFDYFNLSTQLSVLSNQWAAADPRFCSVCQYIPGARMLRQDPVECAFQFICSSNNHISRIHGMVERLCKTYGTALVKAKPTSDPNTLTPQQLFKGDTVQQCDSTAAVIREGATAAQTTAAAAAELPPTPAPAALLTGGAAGAAMLPLTPTPTIHPSMPSQLSSNTPNPPLPTLSSHNSSSNSLPASPTTPAQSYSYADTEDDLSVLDSLSFFAFPTLEQLASATEADLRADGFGYRAKFITGSVQQLLAKPEGGAAWLLALRQVPYEEAVQQLTTLPGIGPKVAACVALFSLDKHQAVPVDTHVWTLATRYYAPRLAGKTLNPKLHNEVQRVFEERFGPYAGWAHNTLFISELASHRELLPLQLQSPGGRSGGGGKGRKRAATKSGADAADGGSSPGDSDSEAAAEGSVLSFNEVKVLGVSKQGGQQLEEEGAAAAGEGAVAAGEGAAAAGKGAVAAGVGAAAFVEVSASGRRKRAATAGVAAVIKAVKAQGEDTMGDQDEVGRAKKRRTKVGRAKKRN